MLYVSFSIGSLLKVLNRCSWYGKAKAQAKERKTQIDSPRNSEAAPRVRGVVSGHYAVARRQLVRQQSGLIKDQLFLVVASLEGVPRRGHHFFFFFSVVRMFISACGNHREWTLTPFSHRYTTCRHGRGAQSAASVFTRRRLICDAVNAAD